ncbi:DUF2330 domain-containing protein [Paralimibaculum aggregatum]|uniref:DUF2330 domain-containing protein n=1 Tax=Paralimibaculum aggregatum TaxID=3036245 RepID=A0ABQ6LQ56_9RHOB|nr:DUF2330 domain-containing protein [Limibaculum sp. NKW23]GMG84635.1 DUF2330 domain-containing protein [Limibaculum sp. NKW23]
MARPLLNLLAIALALAALLIAPAAGAFCGFYAARGDARLFNDASKVVMVRDEDRTVITMVSDFAGEAREFAMVVPAPEVLAREQIRVVEAAIIDHLDAYTAPRLVEYFDPDPCLPLPLPSSCPNCMSVSDSAPPAVEDSLGVTVEAEYTVGEYDIAILSAAESDGLVTWLDRNGYAMPENAGPVLAGYIDMGMKFFVARVNLAEHAAAGGGVLRPLQIAFESDDFMLPIRLGMVNARGLQDLILLTLTRTGRVETENYAVSRMPTGQEIPVYVRDRFGETYKAIFAEAVRREGGAAVMLEYAWDMAWCDPCAADPLSQHELQELGVSWAGAGAAPDVFVTRLHARYDAARFPEDLRLRVTSERENFQGRYVLRHPFTAAASCPAGRNYQAGLAGRFEREAALLAGLTGWKLDAIRNEMRAAGITPDGDAWWERLWPR